MTMRRMDQETIRTIRMMTERYFETANDPDQMRIAEWSAERILALHPSALNVLIENGEPVSWTVSIPTSRKSAERFLRGEIDERVLTDTTSPSDRYEALYLCMAFTVPEYRGRGYATKLFAEAIADIPLEDDALLYAWIWSEEGGRLVRRLEAMIGRRIRVRR